jgi:hypothetical protein
MSRFAITGMALVLLMALMIISISGIDSQDKLTGFAVSEEKTQPENLPSTYSIVPVSKISINYTFSEYPKLVSEAKRLVAKCAGNENVTGCLDTYLKRSWSIAGNESSIYRFDVAGAEKLPAYDEAEKKIVDKPVIYRLALDFS